MNTLQKVRAVERLFKTLEKDIKQIQDQTGISCVRNCIKCCTTPRIEATALEFYPLAYHLFKTGQSENIIAKIEQTDNYTICPVLNNFTIDELSPGCNHYDQRGLICRLFSYNYGTDKYGRRRINACKTIRVEQPQQLDIANQLLQIKALGPKASNYYSWLQFIDFNEAHRLYPIGKAIKTAIETVITYFHYSGKKAM